MDDLTALSNITDTPELYLADEDKEKFSANLELLDIKNANSITIYGADIQKKMAELSEMMIKSVGETNVDEISDTIDKTVEYLSLTEENENVKKERSIFPWKKKSSELEIKNP